MKPQNLKSPFIWNKRYTLIQDRIWYVSDCYELDIPFVFPGWDNPQIFPKEQPICIEYCSGNGAWIVDRAQEHPEKNWVAVERKFDRVRKIWSKVKNYQLSNLFIVCGEGYYVTQKYLPSSSVEAVYINFPDPWPKTRHAKHRLVQVPFITEIQRVLWSSGMLTLVTDDEGYSKAMIEVLRKISNFSSAYSEPYYVTDDPNYGSSYFEDLWRQKGKTIRYHKFINVTP